jgi:hypothetical protein
LKVEDPRFAMFRVFEYGRNLCLEHSVGIINSILRELEKLRRNRSTASIENGEYKKEWDKLCIALKLEFREMGMFPFP